MTNHEEQSDRIAAIHNAVISEIVATKAIDNQDYGLYVAFGLVRKIGELEATGNGGRGVIIQDPLYKEPIATHFWHQVNFKQFHVQIHL